MTHLSYDMFRCPGKDLKDCATCLRRIVPGHPTYRRMAYGHIDSVSGKCDDLIKGDER